MSYLSVCCRGWQGAHRVRRAAGHTLCAPISTIHECDAAVLGRIRIGRGALLGRALDLVPGGAARQARLQAQTAAAEFELVQGGAVVTRRLDLLVGSASRGGARTR